VNRVLAAALLFVVGAGSALAAGYDDFSRGVNANNRGDAETAISAFSAALASGDLAAAYIPTAHVGRAKAYLQKDNCAEALSDLDDGIKLKADDADVFYLRADAKVCLNKLDAAQIDFNQAIGLRPRAPYYEWFAQIQWLHGFFPQAAENFAQAVKQAAEGNKHKPYILLWFAMSAGRAGTFDQAKFAADVSALGSDEWPVPLLDFYRGKTAVDKVYSEAASKDAQIAINQKCEADFYIGEWQLARKNTADAKSLLQQAVGECPHGFIEFSFAQAELKRLP